MLGSGEMLGEEKGLKGLLQSFTRRSICFHFHHETFLARFRRWWDETVAQFQHDKNNFEVILKAKVISSLIQDD
jgi:hypothetical protein